MNGLGKMAEKPALGTCFSRLRGPLTRPARPLLASHVAMSSASRSSKGSRSRRPERRVGTAAAAHLAAVRFAVCVAAVQRRPAMAQNADGSW